MKNVSKILIIVLFFTLLILPIVNVNFSKDTLSVEEKRYLANIPDFGCEDYNIKLEDWLNDNIGFRRGFINFNANVLYRIFNVLPKDSGFLIGPKGELNYFKKELIENYQRINLATPGELRDFGEAISYIDRYTRSLGARFYYVQNWDKDSIYPEEYPETIYQQSDISKIEQKVKELKKHDINLISLRDDFIKFKDKYRLYPVYGDVSHYTERGAYITYRKLMEKIGGYKILDEDDYDIKIIDMGNNLYSSTIHKTEMLEQFNIKNPRAKLSTEKVKIDLNDNWNINKVYQNDYIDNNDTVIIMGDSYMDSFLADDIAESFRRTIMVPNMYIMALPRLIDAYKPKVVIYETVERQDIEDAPLYIGKALKEYFQSISVHPMD